jgi:hypothetical protein
MAGGGVSPCLYQKADFFYSRFWLCHKKIVRAQNQTGVYVHFFVGEAVTPGP